MCPEPSPAPDGGVAETFARLRHELLGAPPLHRLFDSSRPRTSPGTGGGDRAS